MGTTELSTEKIEEALRYQNRKRIRSLPLEEKKELKNVRRKIKRMSEKCQKKN